MIKFFRRIRQNMIKENKVSKYLIYAIGEVLLVVIGILIAVQLNNLNEHRKEKLVEIEILEGIRNDILKDTIDINFNIRAYKRVIKTDSISLDHLIHKKEKTKQIISYLNFHTYGDWVIMLHESHFQEAKQKGLSIITNKSLRESISRLYEYYYKALIISENSSEGFNHLNLLRHELGQYFGYDATGIIMSDASYKKLIFNKNTLYYIRQGQQIKRTLLSFHLSIKESALQVADSINKELDYLKK
ncbi:hypothetical protein JYU05_01970 [bacterium AH-315-P13]|nr:hypothetical protein [bacterium AH-315-P13]